MQLAFRIFPALRPPAAARGKGVNGGRVQKPGLEGRERASATPVSGPFKNNDTHVRMLKPASSPLRTRLCGLQVRWLGNWFPLGVAVLVDRFLDMFITHQMSFEPESTQLPQCPLCVCASLGHHRYYVR